MENKAETLVGVRFGNARKRVWGRRPCGVTATAAPRVGMTEYIKSKGWKKIPTTAQKVLGARSDCGIMNAE
jgi:hypothetical protein